jgi:hypothetical protein
MADRAARVSERGLVMELKLKLVKAEVKTLVVGHPPNQEQLVAIRHTTRDGAGNLQTSEWIVLNQLDIETLKTALQAAQDHMAGTPPTAPDQSH